MKSLTTLLLTLALLVAAGIAPDKAAAQTVTGNQNISFGRIIRGGTATVDYSSSDAATFTVTGKQKKKVRITVTTTDLTLSKKSLVITVTTSDCAYSTDGGVTWTTFSTGTLFQDVTIPKDTGNGSQGSVEVRVGGSVTSSTTQSRGDYAGTITVTAAYQ